MKQSTQQFTCPPPRNKHDNVKSMALSLLLLSSFLDQSLCFIPRHRCLVPTTPSRSSSTCNRIRSCLKAEKKSEHQTDDEGDEAEDKTPTSSIGGESVQNRDDEERERRKSQVAKAAAQIIKRNEEEESTGLLDKLNPFQEQNASRKWERGRGPDLLQNDRSVPGSHRRNFLQ